MGSDAKTNEAASTLAPGSDLMRVYMQTESSARLSRFLRVDPSYNVFDQLPKIIQLVEASFNSPVTSASLVAVAPHKQRHCLRSHSFRYTNICGKIHHLYSPQFFAPGVLPLVVRVVNGFGHFECLYSVHTNLLTAQNRHNTLFRGGRSCAEIDRVIQHAFCDDAINAVNVHMMVANVRMPHPINISCLVVDRALAAHPALTCVSMCMTEEQSYMKSIKITRVLAEFQRLHLAPDLVDENMSMLLNLSRSGSINVFLTITKDVQLRADLEHEYTPLLAEVLRIVDQYT